MGSNVPVLLTQSSRGGRAGGRDLALVVIQYSNFLLSNHWTDLEHLVPSKDAYTHFFVHELRL